MTFIAMGIMEKAGRRALMMCTWVGMCSGFGIIYVAGSLGEGLGVLPDLMSNLQVTRVTSGNAWAARRPARPHAQPAGNACNVALILAHPPKTPQVVAMVITIMSFAVGVGNVEGFLISEIMPVYAKDTLASIGQPLNWIANLIVSTFFPIIFAAMGR